MLKQLKRIKQKLPFLSGLHFTKDGRFNLSYEAKKSHSYATEPYRYTNEDAKRVYDIIMASKTTHNTGEEINNLEKEFASYTGTKYALAVNSGTSALFLACKAIGLKPGDEVIVPAYTFVATAQAVLSVGGIPVFADLDETFNISPKDLIKKISKKTKAVIVVHMFGNVANMTPILRICKAKKILVIEDCAQAVGATYLAKKVGAVGDIGCFSFNEKKAIPTGQGGILTTSNQKFFEAALFTRNTGITNAKKMDVATQGGTYFMTEMQAALARIVLSQIDVLNAQRRKNFMILKQNISLISGFATPYKIPSGTLPSFSRLVFTINFEKLGITRKTFIEKANALGIPLRTFYPTPLYKFSLFKKRRDSITNVSYPFNLKKNLTYQDLPFVENFCKNQVGMEFSPYLSSGDILEIMKIMGNITSARTDTVNLRSRTAQKQDKRLQVAVLGLGGISEVHLKALSESPLTNISAICDSNSDYLKKHLAKYPKARGYLNYKKAIVDSAVNTVDITLPHHLHFDTVMATLKSGKSVICEKPLVTNLKDLLALESYCKKSGKWVFVKHYLRFSNLHQEAFDSITKKNIGETYLINALITLNSQESFVNPKDWKTNIKQGGGGVLMDNGIHIIDYLVYLFGKPTLATAQTAQLTQKNAAKGEDLAVVNLKFGRHIFANITATSVDSSGPMRSKIDFYATGGRLSLETNGKTTASLSIIKNGQLLYDKKDDGWWEKANINALNDIFEKIATGKAPSVSLTHIKFVLGLILNSYKYAKRKTY